MNWFKRIFHYHIWYNIKETAYKAKYDVDGSHVNEYRPEASPTYYNSFCVRCGKTRNDATTARNADQFIENTIRENKEKWYNSLSNNDQIDVFVKCCSEK